MTTRLSKPQQLSKRAQPSISSPAARHSGPNWPQPLVKRPTTARCPPASAFASNRTVSKPPSSSYSLRATLLLFRKTNPALSKTTPPPKRSQRTNASDHSDIDSIFSGVLDGLHEAEDPEGQPLPQQRITELYILNTMVLYPSSSGPNGYMSRLHRFIVDLTEASWDIDEETYNKTFDVAIQETIRAIYELKDTGVYTLISGGETFRPSSKGTRDFWTS